MKLFFKSPNNTKYFKHTLFGVILVYSMSYAQADCLTVSSNLFEDFKDCLILAKKGKTKAQFNLGVMYYLGEGVTQDYKEAFKWCQKSAEQRNVEAQFNLGSLYYRGEGVAQDYKEALKWYQKLAEQGNSRAQFNLGVMYDHGEGVAENYSEAIKWYKKSAEQGYVDAQFNLEKLTIDYKEAVKNLSLLRSRKNTKVTPDKKLIVRRGEINNSLVSTIKESWQAEGSLPLS